MSGRLQNLIVELVPGARISYARGQVDHDMDVVTDSLDRLRAREVTYTNLHSHVPKVLGVVLRGGHGGDRVPFSQQPLAEKPADKSSRARYQDPLSRHICLPPHQEIG